MQLHSATAMLGAGDGGSALELMTRLVRAHPGRTDVLHRYGVVLARTGRDAEAAVVLQKVVALTPGSMNAASDHANVLLQLGRNEEALEVLQTCLAATSEDPAARDAATFNFNLGRAYKLGGFALEAVAPLRQTLAWYPQHYAALLVLGDVYKALGNEADAASCYRQAMTVQPADGTAWWSLSNLKSSAFTDGEFAQLQHSAQDSNDTAQNVFFEFALATGFDQRDQIELAFAHYRKGNQLKRQLEPWDREEFSRWLENIRVAMEHVDIDPRPASWSGPRPIFLVSLPRSGSTLTEQILAAHSGVTAASELPAIPRVLADQSRRMQSSMVSWSATLDPGGWQRLGAEYLDLCRPWYRDTAAFTDKLPGNISHVGALLAMLPDALVIHVRRDAMDVCWSCYRQLFIGGAGFANDFQDLAAYWQDQQRHMAYWQHRLPDRVLSVDYELLVTEPERETRRLLEFLDLPFEAACLEPHATERAVSTPSSLQVRQKIHTKGIGHWRRYATHLEELLAAFSNSG